MSSSEKVKRAREGAAPSAGRPLEGQTKGRKGNAAQPLGKREGLVSETATRKTGARSRKAAGPDGPDATAVGETFKA